MGLEDKSNKDQAPTGKEKLLITTLGILLDLDSVVKNTMTMAPKLHTTPPCARCAEYEGLLKEVIDKAYAIGYNDCMNETD
jgi:hypothetical protein